MASVALAPRERLGTERVHFAVDVSGAADGPWTVAAARSFVPADDPEQALWHPLTADLSRWAGEELWIRLRAFAGGDPADPADGLGGSARLARAYWGAPALSPGERGERPSFLLVTLDTTRADAVGAGSPTPYLNELGRQGMVFESAWAPSNSTQPAHASILTGTWVQDHGVVNNFCLLAPENTTLAERLRAAGYLTAGAVSQQFIGAGAGFGQGFDWFRQADPGAAFDGAPTVRAARAWLDEWAAAGAPPFFLWLHLFDPHTPYTPSDEWLASFASRFGATAPPRDAEPATLPLLAELPDDMDFLRDVSNAEWGRYMYRAEVSYADALVENLASALAAHGRLESTAIAVVADHGESLGERSSWFNHNGVFRETVHVPLVLRVPGGPRGARVRAPVSSVDVAPTFLALAGLDAGGSRGLDLVRVARGAPGAPGAPGTREIWFEHSDGLQAGLVDGRHAFITTLSERMSFGLETYVDERGRTLGRNRPVARGTSYLYDLELDPLMQRDLAAERPELVRAYLARLEAWRATAGDVRSLRRDVSAAEAEDMADIGYVDGGEDDG
jgi:arylsulfatase A-like enzyme